MSYQKVADIINFHGIDNVTDPSKMVYDPKKGEIYFRTAVNIDINDDFRIQRSLGPTIVQAGVYHNFWSAKDIGFCMSSGTLYSVAWNGTVLTMVVVKTGLEPSAKMNYVEAGQQIFMTNGLWIGYYQDGVIYDMPAANQEFCETLPPGHLIEFYNNQLYVAVNNQIIFSDSTAWNRYDTRHNMILFPSRIRMIQSVNTGIFVSDEEGISYLSGKIGLELEFSPKLEVPVFPGGFKQIDSKLIGGGIQLEGCAVIMLTSKGIYLGGSTGTFLDMTGGKYIPTEMTDINGMVRADNDKHQLIFIGAYEAEALSGELDVYLPKTEIRLS